MHSLYVDSSAGLVIGLLDANFNWIEYLILDEKKPSEIIHYEILNLTKKYKLDLRKLTIFVSSGPGSYTGMRLSEGLAQIFELSKLNVYSFYHFDVPRLIGIKNGFWATNAFKGQVFTYTWNLDASETNLIDKTHFSIVDKKIGFTLDNTDPLFEGLKSSKEIIKNESSKLFKKVLDLKLREKPYYFRSLDQEFC